jgi:CheY-like chemotaxis protein
MTAALFEDEQVDTIECESAEAALATLLIGGREVAMIFADVRLCGVMDGIDLAREVKMRWPRLSAAQQRGCVSSRVAERRDAFARLHSITSSAARNLTTDIACC